jgi:mannosyltransferase
VVRFALPLFVLPGAALLIESALAMPLYGGTRYVLYSAAAAAMLAGQGAYKLATLGAHALRSVPRPHAVLAPAAAAVVLALTIAGWPAQEALRTPAGRPQDNAAASAFLAAHAHAGDGILYIPEASGLAELGYPSDFAKLDPLAVAVSPRASGQFYGIQKSFAQTRSAVLAHNRVWEFSNNGSTGMSPRQYAERRVLQHRFTMALSHSFKGVKVMLWVK